jgi:hypothetical protein
MNESALMMESLRLMGIGMGIVFSFPVAAGRHPAGHVLGGAEVGPDRAACTGQPVPASHCTQRRPT